MGAFESWGSISFAFMSYHALSPFAKKLGNYFYGLNCTPDFRRSSNKHRNGQPPVALTDMHQSALFLIIFVMRSHPIRASM